MRDNWLRIKVRDQNLQKLADEFILTQNKYGVHDIMYIYILIKRYISSNHKTFLTQV